MWLVSVCAVLLEPKAIKAMQHGFILSPDHRYVAYAAHGEADAYYLAVTGARGSNRKDFRQFEAYFLDPGGEPPTKPLIEANDLTGVLWVPSRPHTLLYSTSGTYGRARLASWTPEHGALSVVRVRRPEDEMFVLLRIDSDGRTVWFDHVNDIDKDVSRRSHIRLSLQNTKARP